MTAAATLLWTSSQRAAREHRARRQFGQCGPPAAILLWAVGHDGQGFSLDAATGGDARPARWLAQNSNTRDDLEAVWGSGPNDVWAVGRRGTIRRTRGASAVDGGALGHDDAIRT